MTHPDQAGYCSRAAIERIIMAEFAICVSPCLALICCWLTPVAMVMPEDQSGRIQLCERVAQCLGVPGWCDPDGGRIGSREI